MVQKIHPKGPGAFLILAPMWKDHKMRLGLVFRPYLKMSLIRLAWSNKKGTNVFLDLNADAKTLIFKGTTISTH